MVDLYFDLQYGELYEKVENGHCEIFEYNHFYGKIRHMFIKREIMDTTDGQTYYDIVTPYGYGGPLILGCIPENRRELVNEFHNAFGAYCAEERVVSEFIRFHPVLDNAHDFGDVYDVRYMRPTVGTNLRAFEDPVAQEFSKTAKKNVRKALGEGVQYRVIENPNNLNDFKDIYYTTMKRKNADDYYFFSDEYFDRLLAAFGDRMVITKATFNGHTLGMALTFKYDKFLHTHLSGTYDEYHHLYPAYVMQFAITRWGKENGYHLLHDGGGLTNDLEDSLYMFKKQFAKHTRFSFQVGRKIWNQDIYAKLCDARDADLESDFFPAYRGKTKKVVNII